ncbi:unnamed protein product [Mycena citricolor]|uniref:Uncharacterized protein n=1 Tax=Mycena citricolor TaxID=2018698 RepID=A0AAD2H5L0_9AGAR|nr:unnamed protein product [Mycena citricolor]
MQSDRAVASDTVWQATYDAVSQATCLANGLRFSTDCVLESVERDDRRRAAMLARFSPAILMVFMCDHGEQDAVDVAEEDGWMMLQKISPASKSLAEQAKHVR